MSILSLQQADIFRILQGRNTRWFILVINLLLVIWIAGLLASLTWTLVTPQTGDQIENVELGPLSFAPDPNAQLIRQLPGWHLMGVVAQKQAPVAVNTPIDAPDTRLKLVLHGVFTSDKTGKGRAIIADPGGREEQYAVGDMLPGNAELSEIYPDRVILRRNGRYETLRLILGFTLTEDRVRRSRVENIQRVVRDIPRKLKQNPRTLLEVIKPKPYMTEDRTMIGYTLQPGREKELFAELGLQTGDVAVQINDVRLDSAAKGMRALNNIKSGDTASLTILRDGQEQVMSFRMPM